MATRAQVLIPIAIAAVIIGIVGVLTIPADSKLEEVKFPMGTIKIDDKVLTVQIAETDAQKVRGLMFQNELPDDQGMIFVFSQAQVVPIWMLNMQFPLDIIWFDSNGNVIHIEKNVQPCKSALETATCTVQNADGKMAKYVLEVTGGFTDKFHITESSKMQIISI
ncbi:MAG: DUF192 domain-containing protein [Thaumarchaeota archaeon]|nr:DUF192 domain-containing protein [Nitrososphaerota archaeon]MDE1817825.1 DUF192 domain-containing protein [Nitrososphaerota archaeon]MDE1875409.1 DUF192 domain-containing protein [Nitrososphaerota archaeon]